MLESIYHMMFELFCNHIFGVKMSRFCQIYAKVSFRNLTEICKPLAVYQFLIHEVISLPNVIALYYSKI